MSHCTVLVVGDDLETLLAPFNENTEVEPYIEGNVWTTYNPQSQWDWYKVGGRWPGHLPLTGGRVADTALWGDVDAARLTPTFAILLNGEWIEKGKMGWWAMVSDEKSDDEWAETFHRVAATIDPAQRVTIVDAHI